MSDKISELFTETILYLVVIDDFRYLLIFAGAIVALLLVITSSLFNKKIGRQRALTFTILTAYSYLSFGASCACIWWFGIIIAVLCFFFVRYLEKITWNGEIEKKKIDGELKDLLISPKGIILNMILSFALAQLIILIVTF